MLALSLLAVLLLGATGALVARGLVFPRLRAAARISDIAAYGITEDDAVASGTRRTRSPGGLAPLANRIGRVLARSERFDTAETKKLLLAAGMYRVEAETYLGYRVLVTAALAALGALIIQPELLVVVEAIVLPVGGWVLSLTLLRRKATLRSEKIEDALPDLVDLLVVTVEAGLSLSSSLQVASRRVDGPLGAELRLALQEQRMGLPMGEALTNMLNRSDTAGLRSFVRSVTQGETLGVSIGTIMRNLAVEMRKRRRSRAEERANKAPIKMLFPLIFLIFPALFIVIIGPGAITLIRTLGNV